jgi:cell division protein FtsW (lipid II flippase)
MIVVEAFGYLIAALLAFALGGAAIDGTLDRAAALTGEVVRAPDRVRADGFLAIQLFIAGIVVLAVGRAVGLRRARDPIPAPWAFPSAAMLAAYGLAVQLGYGDPVHRAAWAGPAFAQGFLGASVVAAVIVGAPVDLFRYVARAPSALLAFAGLVFAALLVVGTGPAGTDTRILLFGVQPLELVKLASALYIGEILGKNAPQLRWHRVGGRFLRWPRPQLLLPAFASLFAIFLGMLVVKDLGPTLVLGLMFLLCFVAVTRSVGFLLATVGLAGGMLAFFIRFPALAPGMLSTRLAMWLDPWLNGVPRGDQLARARWAMASGGLTGQGFGRSPEIGALPAGHTDLAFAQLIEDAGAGNAVVWLLVFAVLLAHGVGIAAAGRTSNRQLTALALTSLLFSQLAVILLGTMGGLPLTGVVVPFLSYGKSGMVAFLAVVALLVRLADDGRHQIDTDGLRDVRGASVAIGLSFGAGLSGMAALALALAVALGPATSGRGVVTVLGDGTLKHQLDPRIEHLLSRLPRGQIRDRDGVVLATTAGGVRTNPLGEALGTLLGAADDRILRESWSIERHFDARLRGYDEAADGPAAWIARDAAGKDRLLFGVASRKPADGDAERAAALAAARGLGAARLLALPAPDLAKVVPLLRYDAESREAELQRQAADIDSRSIRLSLRADLQKEVQQALVKAAKSGKAAAAVVIDVDSGAVLARAQVPDYDPSASGWRALSLGPDDAARKKFFGVWGAWPDKTGLRGVVQAGSVAKLFTAMAAARAGRLGDGAPKYRCDHRDEEGPYFTRKGWTRPIHDFRGDALHGELGLERALAVSCNVWFGQLGLDLGPGAPQDLLAAGVDIGFPDRSGGFRFPVGKEGSRDLASTAFGQGGAAMSVTQAGRLVAAIAAGGRYRECDPHLEAEAPCSDVDLAIPEDAVGRIASGMRGVMARGGTGAGLHEPEGLDVYGKTGTADAIGLPGELPWGARPQQEGLRPHSWFVAWAERTPVVEDGEPPPPWDPRRTGRIAVAVVVFRGGTGASAAGPAAMAIFERAAGLGVFDR